jgi:hypothetical protein
MAEQQGLRIQEGQGPKVAMNQYGDAYRQVVETVFSDSPSIDAFGRLRVSEPTLLIDLKQVGNTPQNTATTGVSGTGAVQYHIDRASTMLTVGPGVGTAIRQSKARAVYQPGKSILYLGTFVGAAAQVGLRQRVGYFDDNNGIFLEQDDLEIVAGIRSSVSGSPVDTRVERSLWNIDPLDGTGPSGIVADFTKAHIMFADAEWLGVGRVRMGFVINGGFVPVHQFLNANNLDSVYMSNPNLPARWEIEAKSTIAGTASLESICASVSSEGGYEILGITASTDAGITGLSVASGATVEILAIRMQDVFKEYATAFAQQISAINVTSGPFMWRLVSNPAQTGAGTWSAVNGSIMEKNTTRTITPDTGIIVASGLVSASTNSVTLDARPVLTLGTTVAGVTDVLSLQIINLNNSAETFYASLTWREVF